MTVSWDLTYCHIISRDQATQLSWPAAWVCLRKLSHWRADQRCTWSSMELGLPGFRLAAPQFLNRAFPALRIRWVRANAWSYPLLLFVGTLEVSGIIVPIVERRVSAWKHCGTLRDISQYAGGFGLIWRSVQFYYLLVPTGIKWFGYNQRIVIKNRLAKYLTMMSDSGSLFWNNSSRNLSRNPLNIPGLHSVVTVVVTLEFGNVFWGHPVCLLSSSSLTA